MKTATVKYPHVLQGENPLVKGIIVESADDIKLIRPELESAERGVLNKFVKSNESADRLAHIVSGFQPMERAIATLSISRGTLRGQNPIYLLGEASATYITTLLKLLAKGYTVFLNPSGGMCVLDETFEIIESEDFAGFTKEAKYYIGKDSEVINLENDFELEDEATDFMRKNFKNYSYIKDMKVLSEYQFIQIFKEFSDQGGTTVYVYTTGMDFEQMYEYSRYALKCGLKQFIFDFNSGLDTEIRKFVAWLKERAEVRVLNEENNN